MKTFYLGTHRPGWLALARCSDVPLFVSRRTLAVRKSLPSAVTRWSLDSGGFSELQLHGRWTTSAEEYVAEVRRYQAKIGRLDWAAPQDWMCEAQVIRGLVEPRPSRACPVCKKAGRKVLDLPVRMRVVALDEEERPTWVCACGHTQIGAPPRIHVGRWRAWAFGAGRVMAESVATADRLGIDAAVVFHGTGLSLREHQRRTIENFIALRRIAPDLPFIPVLQGSLPDTYVDHARAYVAAGIDLQNEPLVGVGSVCRRQGTQEGTWIMRVLAAIGLKLHGFGYKTLGLRRVHHLLESADSMAWSDRARHAPPLPGHDKPGPGRRTGHANCAGCLDYALIWRDALLASLKKPAGEQQLDLFAGAAA